MRFAPWRPDALEITGIRSQPREIQLRRNCENELQDRQFQKRLSHDNARAGDENRELARARSRRLVRGERGAVVVGQRLQPGQRGGCKRLEGNESAETLSHTSTATNTPTQYYNFPHSHYNYKHPDPMTSDMPVRLGATGRKTSAGAGVSTRAGSPGASTREWVRRNTSARQPPDPPTA